VTDELISDSFVQEQNHLRFRSLILRSLVAAVYLSEDIHPARVVNANAATNGNASDSEKSDKMIRVIEELSAKMRETADACGNVNMDEDWMNPVQGPDRPRINLFLRDGLHTFHR
jgi:hypothetical protein